MSVAASLFDVANTDQGHHPSHRYGRDFSSAGVVAAAALPKSAEIAMGTVVSTCEEVVCNV